MRKIVLLAMVVLVASCDNDAFGPERGFPPPGPNRLIQDATHNAGNRFFYWLAPVVKQPSSQQFGTLDVAANPTVRVICEAASDPATCPGGVIGSVVATFTTGDGVTFDRDHYKLELDTKATFEVMTDQGPQSYAFHTSSTDPAAAYTTYQLQVVLTRGGQSAIVGLASFQLGLNGGEARNLADPDNMIGLVNGRSLPVNFRVELSAFEYATAEQDPCPEGCSTTRIDPETGGTASFTDPDLGVPVTAVVFQGGDLPPLPEGFDEYTLLIGPLSTETTPGETSPEDACAYNVALDKFDCYRYTLFPDVEEFVNPVRFGICPIDVGESLYRRLVKVDQENGQAVVRFPDPVDVSDFLPCVFPAPGGAGAMLERAFHFALDRIAPPLFAQTSTRVWGGMAKDFSDIFWTIEQGLISHWTADQLLGAYNDAMAFDPTTVNHGDPNDATHIAEDGGIVGSAFEFEPPIFDPEAGLVTEGGTILAPARGIAALQTLSLSAWVRIDAQAPSTVIQRFVTIQQEKAVIRMDGETQPGQLHFYATFEGVEGNELVHVRSQVPMAQGCYQHVAGTYDGSTLRLYLNGQEVGSAEHSGTLILGNGVELSSPHETLRGRLDEVRIHDRALTAKEIAALYAAGADGVAGTCITPLPEIDIQAANAVAVGGQHTCALNVSGQAYCWGSNLAGELGTGALEESRTPVLVSGGVVFDQISAAGRTTCALTPQGVPYCWGANGAGQLGTGDQTSRTTPTRVTGDLLFEEIDVGALAFTCGLTSAGQAYCWGHNDQGQLGTGDLEPSPRPVPVQQGELAFVSITAGLAHACGLTADGQAWCWGDGGFGALGTADLDDRLEPTPVTGELTFTSLVAGATVTCGITSGSGTYCWGSDFFGSLGMGQVNFGTQLFPAPISGDQVFVAAGEGDENNIFTVSCGVTAAGSGYCWGANAYGGLGSFTAPETCGPLGSGELAGDPFSCTATPQAISGRHTFAALFPSGGFACGLTTNGQLYCWGWNSAGQLGSDAGQESCNVFGEAEPCRWEPRLVEGGLVLPSS